MPARFGQKCKLHSFRGMQEPIVAPTLKTSLFPLTSSRWVAACHKAGRGKITRANCSKRLIQSEEAPWLGDNYTSEHAPLNNAARQFLAKLQSRKRRSQIHDKKTRQGDTFYLPSFKPYRCVYAGAVHDKKTHRLVQSQVHQTSNNLGITLAQPII